MPDGSACQCQDHQLRAVEETDSRGAPDFPKKGILFYDITTLLKDKKGFAMLIDALAERYIRSGH